MCYHLYINMDTTSRKYSYLVAAIILVWLTSLAVSQPWVRFVDDTNLIFHEAGHAIFGFFGEIVALLAGSVFQVLLPLSIAVAFSLKRDWLGALVMLWWVGENMIGVGRYVADASKQALPLLGGEHDWALLFAHAPNLFPYDTMIGGAVRNIGIVIMCTSVLLLVFLFAWAKNMV